MMNAARLAVGVQGVAVAERATQRAFAYAKERRQGRARPRAAATAWRRSSSTPTSAASLMTMKALTQAARAICLVTAKETDVARRAKNAAEQAAAAHRVALLTPDRQGLLHRHRLRGGLDRRAGARRHGLHRGDRRGADLSRRAHPADLRGHQRHPGHRPRHAQAAAGRRQGGGGLHRRAQADGRRRARLQPARVRPHGRAPRRGRRCAGRGHALDGRRAALQPGGRTRGRHAVSAAVRPRGRRRLPRQGRAGGRPRRDRPTARRSPSPASSPRTSPPPRPASRRPSSPAPTPRSPSRPRRCPPEAGLA